MRMHLLSLDTSYINYIEKGPHVPVKINTRSDLMIMSPRMKKCPRTKLNSEKKMEKRCTRIRRP